MRLITELTEENRIITEATEDGKKNLFIEGIWLQADIKNRNGRCYPSAIMEREVDRYSRDYINKGRAMGELGHPEGPQINLDRVSHRIVSLRREGSNFMGKAMITDTPMGNIARGLIESGVCLGVSSRGMGSLKERNGVMEVQEDFYLATAGDIVADPSAPSAFVNGIYEGAEWVWSNGALKEMQLDEVKKDVKYNWKSFSEEKKLMIFERLLRKF
jgi:hypothetical protein